MSDVQQFVVSVGDAYMFDPQNNDAYIGSSKTLLDSSISVSMSSEEVRAGFGAQKIFEFFHSRNVECTLNSASFDLSYLAMNVGQSILSGVEQVWKFGECVTLSGGNGTVSDTPIGDILVQMQDGTIVETTPDGNSFSVPEASNETVTVSYRYNALIDKVTIDAGAAPKIIKVVQQYKVFSKAGQIGILEVEIPRLQLTGNFDLSFTTTGVAASQMTGVALATGESACGEPIYAVVKFIPHTTQTVQYNMIATTPSEIELEVGDTIQLTTYGIRGGIYANTLLAPSSLTYASDITDVATVDSNGVITAVAEGTALITVKHNDSGKTDVVSVEVVEP